MGDTGVENSQGASSVGAGKTSQEKEKKRTYNEKKCAIIIWVLIVVVFMVAVFGIPWLIGFVKWVFSKIPTWVDGPEGDALQFDLGVLPDFLGGMVGILVGFLMEWLLFSQLKTLSKYKALKRSLGVKLNDIYKSCQQIKNDSISYYFIEMIALDDIVLIADNNAVFYSLPFNFGKNKDKLFHCLLDIYANIKQYNLAQKCLMDDLKNSQKKQNEEIEKQNEKIDGLIESIMCNIAKFCRMAGIDLNPQENQTGDNQGNQTDQGKGNLKS